MTPDRTATAGRLLMGSIVLVYPIIIYLLLDELGPAVLGLFLLALLALRAKVLIRRLPLISILIAAVGGIFLLFILRGDGALALKFYPTLMNLFLLAAFAYTLWNPPSMIERIARSAGFSISIRTGPYTRIVTMLWCFFFAANALVTAVISISGSMKTWAMYNGVISYGLVAAFLVGEYIFRYFYKRRHGITGSAR
jgi:uncharacterized membrane protein